MNKVLCPRCAFKANLDRSERVDMALSIKTFTQTRCSECECYMYMSYDGLKYSEYDFLINFFIDRDIKRFEYRRVVM